MSYIAGPAEMMRFGRRLKTATFNSLADKHLWLSVLNRPAQSRFTRVQRATCCVTLLFTFIAVNAMWYGMLKRNNASFVVGEFGWEEVVLGFISNIMVFPINIGIIFLFKKSRSKVRVQYIFQEYPRKAGPICPLFYAQLSMKFPHLN